MRQQGDAADWKRDPAMADALDEIADELTGPAHSKAYMKIEMLHDMADLIRKEVRHG